MEIACVDSTVLIEHYRAKDKTKTFLFWMIQAYIVHIPSVVRYEVLRGDRLKDDFWLNYFANKIVLPFDNACASTAAVIYATLKANNQLIGAEDILIAATALTHNLPLATINTKHFSRVDNLRLIAPDWAY